MPANHVVKRNSLSSKWGVWRTEADSSSPVERLVAELKTSEDAESYCARIEAGEPHDAILASLTAKKPKQQRGGLFGRLRKRMSEPGQDPDIDAPVSNAVIEIETPEKKAEDQATESSEVDEPKPDSVEASEAPSRFQLIEQPPAPAPAVSPVEPVTSESASPDGERIKMVTNPASLSAKVEAAFEDAKPEEIPASGDSSSSSTPTSLSEPPTLSSEVESPEVRQDAEPEPVNPQQAMSPQADSESPDTEVPAVEEQDKTIQNPVQLEPVISEVTAAPPAPKTEEQPAQSNGQPDRDQNGVLVNWTFTPPPDVTPEELRSSGQEAGEISQNTAPVEQSNQVDPEWAEGPNSSSIETISQDAKTGRVTVDICVSKSLKEMSSGDPRVSDKKYNSIASKEYTEVSKAFATGNSQVTLREELTHLAAVCLAWADAIEKRAASKKQTEAA